ncbi:MAG: NAD(P)-dependent malic enzyme [Candidatus Njordarchaeia archaeon]
MSIIIRKKKADSEIYKEALELHKKYRGKIQVVSKVPFRSLDDLALVYTPGVAEPCRKIAENPDNVWELTNRSNMIAVISDGTRVLGLGDIGPEAGLPVMEGKALLFKLFGGVDAVPLVIDTKDPEKIIEFVKIVQTSFGGINLEDIESPKCFYILETLEKELHIPIWHDDQQGTALVTLAGLINALKVVGKKKEEVKIVVNGAGAAGYNFVKFLLMYGFPGKNILVTDSVGIIYKGRKVRMNPFKEKLAEWTNPEAERGGLENALEGADVLLSASASGPWIPKQWIKKMADDAIVFAEANPVPEILPEDALDAGAKIVATGRSDYPNQINNVLGFPAVFRGALDVAAKTINDKMIIAAAETLARVAEEKGLKPDYIIPRATEPEWAPEEAAAVAKAAMESGVARRKVDPEEVKKNARELVERHMKIIKFLFPEEMKNKE